MNPNAPKLPETRKPRTLFTLGEALAVFLAEEGLPLAEATRFRRIVAGSESNVAAGFVRLGHRSRLVTTVGRDALGDAVESTLRSWGIDSIVGRSNLATGTLVRGLGTGHGVEAVHLRTEAAATELSAADIDAAWSNDTDVVFVTGITAVRSATAREAVLRTIDLARETGALVVVDPNIRTRLAPVASFRSALAGIRGHVDVAIGDPDELAVLSGVDRADAVGALLKGGCRAVVTKLGPEGAWATDGRTEHRIPSRAGKIVDTVGAGDAFAAGLIGGLVEGGSLPEALELASFAAAQVVATPGDVEGFPRNRPRPDGSMEGHKR